VVRPFLIFSCAAWLIALPASAESGRALAPRAQAVLLLNSDGKVLFSKNADGDHAPASLVKLMTLYLAYEDLDLGRVHWDEPVKISRRAAQTPRFRMGLHVGQSVPFRTLLEGVAIASANDAATAVAEHLADSEGKFVERMNVRARELELLSTRFANCHGLPDPFQRSTAEDLARLTGRLLQDFPASRILLGSTTFIHGGRVYSRRIPLFQNPGGVQALKTGFTREAGYNLSVAAWRSGQRFLLIVLGAHTRGASFRDAKTLLQFGFHQSGIEVAEEPRRPTSPARRRAGRPRAALPTGG